MSAKERRKISFVRALSRGGSATLCTRGLFQIDGTSQPISLPVQQIKELESQGVIVRDEQKVTSGALTKNWLRRQLATKGEEFLDQHRVKRVDCEGRTVNLNESPLSRLASKGKTGMTFLKPHHVEAGEKLRQLVERAQLRKRITMSYVPDKTASKNGTAAGSSDVSDMALDARREIDRALSMLPVDCADVVIDVCGFEKGLQQVESERGWPRRSAKLVLRIGLEQLARHFGFLHAAIGSATR